MNTRSFKTRMIQLCAAAGAFAAVSLGAAAPAAANSLHGEWSAWRFDTRGWSTIEMGPVASTFCFLTRVDITETDTGSEIASCEIWRNNSTGKWTLTAFLNATSDADVQCAARCYNQFD